jgi:hypothetical protein
VAVRWVYDPVSSIKENMLLNSYPENNKGGCTDLFLFMLLLLFGVVYSVLSLLLLPFVLLYTIYIMVKNKK